MTTITLVIREDSDEEEPEKEKEKEEKEKEKDDKVEDFSDLETKEKEKESEKEKVTLEEMKVMGLKMNGKRMRPRIGMKAIGPMKMKQRGNQKGKGKGKKGHGPQDQGKGQGDGKGEETYVNPSHSSQSSSQQAALPSSSNASGFFVTHSSMYLTSVKMMEGEDQQKEPDSSGCAFLGQEPDSAMKVEEEGIAFHTKNQTLPTMAILDLGCTRAMSSKECYQCFLWIRGQARLWTMVQDWAYELKILLSKFSANKVRWEVGHSHVWQGMACAHYWIWRRKCSTTDVTSSDEKYHAGVLQFRMRAKWCPTNPSVQSNQGQSFLSILPDSCFCFAFSGFEGAVWAACLQTNWHPLGLESCLGFCCFGCVPNGAPQTVSATLRGGVRGLEGMSLASSLMRISGHSCVFLNHLPTTCHVIVTARCHAPSMRFVDIFGDEGMGPMWPHCIERLALQVSEHVC